MAQLLFLPECQRRDMVQTVQSIHYRPYRDSRRLQAWLYVIKKQEEQLNIKFSYINRRLHGTRV